MRHVASGFAALLSLVLIQVAGAQAPIHTERSLYRNILVTEENGQRCMRFAIVAGAGRQSCQLLQDPRRLVFAYTRMMMGALYLQPAPRRILVLGLGGGSLPSALAKVLPQAEIDVVEIDPAVTRVARRYFGFATGPKLRVHEEDGRVYVKRALRAGRKFDLVMLDAFDHDYIPEHLLTREFLQEVKSLLSPGGVIAANTFSTSRLYYYESATYDAVFGPFYNLRLENRVILAAAGPLPSRDVIARNAQALEASLAPLGIDREWLLERFATERNWPADTRVLTDQFSPSNLLNTK